MKEITTEKLVKYLEITKKALAGVKIKMSLSPENKKKAEDILDFATRYFNDANFYREKKDFVTAFAAVNYAHAWLDAGARLGLLKVDESVKEFFAVD